MKRLPLFLIIVMLPSLVRPGLIFQGIVQTPDVNKNTFLCPQSAADAMQGCLDEQSLARGFDIAGGRTIQFCSNQQYWLQQEAIRAQYLVTVERYKGTSLQQKLKEEGWNSMGCYCVVITTDPLIVDFVMPEVVATTNQLKVVVQLWYSGGNLIQLWSQDAAVFTKGASFQVNISSVSDDRLSKIVANKTTSSWKDNFLSKLNIQPNNRQAANYDIAIGSPRSIRIVA